MLLRRKERDMCMTMSMSTVTTTDIWERRISMRCANRNTATGIFRSALVHTAKIAIFIFIFSLVINVIIEAVGEESIARIFNDVPVLGEAAAALVGLIPNCAASVIITELYLQGILSAGAMMSGLLVSAGVGLVVLFRMNRHRPVENIRIAVVLYAAGLAWGLIINALGITF